MFYYKIYLMLLVVVNHRQWCSCADRARMQSDNITDVGGKRLVVEEGKRAEVSCSGIGDNRKSRGKFFIDGNEVQSGYDEASSYSYYKKYKQADHLKTLSCTLETLEGNTKLEAEVPIFVYKRPPRLTPILNPSNLSALQEGQTATCKTPYARPAPTIEVTIGSRLMRDLTIETKANNADATEATEATMTVQRDWNGETFRCCYNGTYFDGLCTEVMSMHVEFPPEQVSLIVNKSSVVTNPSYTVVTFICSAGQSNPACDIIWNSTAGIHVISNQTWHGVAPELKHGHTSVGTITVNVSTVEREWASEGLSCIAYLNGHPTVSKSIDVLPFIALTEDQNKDTKGEDSSDKFLLIGLVFIPLAIILLVIIPAHVLVVKHRKHRSLNRSIIIATVPADVNVENDTADPEQNVELHYADMEFSERSATEIIIHGAARTEYADIDMVNTMREFTKESTEKSVE